MIHGQPVTFGGKPDLQEKTVTPTTSKQTVTPDTDYDGLSKVTVNAIPSTYVKPSATKEATTYTPTTSNQTIAAGTYCSGKQTIQGDSDLKAANIAEGVSIFGVTGTFVCPPTLLWTNASPTSNFNPQTVSLTLTNYDAVLVEIAYSTGDTGKTFKNATYLEKGSSPEYGTWWIGTTFTNSSGTQVSHVQREVQSITNTGVKFGYGKSNNSEVATVGIPTRIWGVKWTL